MLVAECRFEEGQRVRGKDEGEKEGRKWRKGQDIRNKGRWLYYSKMGCEKCKRKKG